jgi:hypothetical protein
MHHSTVYIEDQTGDFDWSNPNQVFRFHHWVVAADRDPSPGAATRVEKQMTFVDEIGFERKSRQLGAAANG